MANPFSATSVSSYNANPPADDGSQVASNIVAWSTIKSKLPDPIKTAFDTSETNTNSAFAKVIGGGGFTSTATNYTVLAADQGKFIKVTASATITTPDATSVGSPFVFYVLNISGVGITVAGNNPGVQQNIDGAASFTLPAGCGVTLNTDGTNWFTGGQNYNGTIIPPQGRLTLTSGTPIIGGDVIAATAVYYTPYTGILCPVWNGTSFSLLSFSEQTLTLQNSSTYAASTVFDIFGFNNSGFTIGIGPAWSNSGAGVGARGTGAATTELQLKNGIWTNKNSITLHNAATAYAGIAANQATYLGSIFMDAVNGQVTCHLSYGQSRKFGIWNAYNRKTIILLGGDGTASWNYASATWRQSNGAAGNKVTTFTGLAEDPIYSEFAQNIVGSTAASDTGQIGVGVNSTTVPGGFTPMAQVAFSSVSITQQPARAFSVNATSFGVNNINMLESSASGTVTYNGTNSNMLMAVNYLG